MENLRTRESLKSMQAAPLSVKVLLTKDRIREWVREYGEEGVYIAFSGGKDSTVLLDIIRNKMGLKNIPFVFVNTGLEYPEIVEFVKSKQTEIDAIERPEMNFKQVIKKYGYPFISKEVSRTVYWGRKQLEARREAKGEDTKLSEFAESLGYEDMTIYISQLLGKSGEWKNATNRPTADDSKKTMYDKQGWLWLVDSPYWFASQCCDVMKKKPSHKYAKETGRVAITAQMADESKLRLNHWIKYGCNAFEQENPISNPMSFWTEQDVLHYIKENNIEICSVYGDIICDESDQLAGQMSLVDFGIDSLEDKPLKTTGCTRTGCMFCGYGCHLNDDQRYVLMKQTHPKIFDYVFRPTSEGGLGYKEIIDWLNEHGNLGIKY